MCFLFCTLRPQVRHTATHNPLGVIKSSHLGVLLSAFEITVLFFFRHSIWWNVIGTCEHQSTFFGCIFLVNLVLGNQCMRREMEVSKSNIWRRCTPYTHVNSSSTDVNSCPFWNYGRSESLGSGMVLKVLCKAPSDKRESNRKGEHAHLFTVYIITDVCFFLCTSNKLVSCWTSWTNNFYVSIFSVYYFSETISDWDLICFGNNNDILLVLY